MGMAMTETCNSEDDDCDGLVDEVLGGCACSCDPHVPLETLRKAVCAPGKLVCRGNPTLACEGCILPGMEICDGKDNDCDGMTDEEDPGMKLCQAGWACITWAMDPDPVQKTRCRPLCNKSSET